jgi:hypothetical protein
MDSAIKNGPENMKTIETNLRSALDSLDWLLANPLAEGEVFSPGRLFYKLDTTCRKFSKAVVKKLPR